MEKLYKLYIMEDKYIVVTINIYGARANFLKFCDCQEIESE